MSTKPALRRKRPNRWRRPKSRRPRRRLHGELKPGGGGTTGYYFDFNTGTSCEGGGNTNAMTASSGKVEAEVGELQPHTKYLFCLVATNNYGATVGRALSYETPTEAPTIEAESVSASVRSATVSAKVGTRNTQSTYYFEYGPNSSYDSRTAPIALAADGSTVGVSAQLTGLAPNTEYHFRLVVTNANDETTEGQDSAFRTLTVGIAGLPDERVYEMVTSPGVAEDVYVPETFGGHESEEGEKNGFETTATFEVAADGSGVTYPAQALAKGFGQAQNGNQNLAERSPTGGWTQMLLQPPARVNTRYEGFSSNLAVGVLVSGFPPVAEEYELLPPLSAEAPGGGYEDLYECEDSKAPCTDTESKALPQNPYRPLFTSNPALNRSPEGPQPFGTSSKYATTLRTAPMFAGGSQSFGDLLFEANDALLAGNGALEGELEEDVKREIANNEDTNYLYDSVEGKLNLVDVAPDGKVMPNATFGGRPQPNLDGPDFSNVISADGNRVYWTDQATLTLYLRENPGQPQSPLDSQGACTVRTDACTIQVSPGAAQYRGASENGRYAFYVEGGELYRFDAEPAAGGEARETLAGAGAKVRGVLGTSKDGDVVYFAAEGVLAGSNSEGAAPQEGEPNLYMWRAGGMPVFVATLSLEDGREVKPYETGNSPYEGFGDWSPSLGLRTARVTGDGGGGLHVQPEPELGGVSPWISKRGVGRGVRV